MTEISCLKIPFTQNFMVFFCDKLLYIIKIYISSKQRMMFGTDQSQWGKNKICVVINKRNGGYKMLQRPSQKSICLYVKFMMTFLKFNDNVNLI